ncbi:hypothetical protein NC651_014380 [Populus alba x Populus x berolinensis]|nr:hypothetical protein NC651_014380 [Populus alba x Populus x berolinensis]
MSAVLWDWDTTPNQTLRDSQDLLVPCALDVWQPLETTDLANTQAIKLSRVLIHVYLCGYCPYGS